MQNLKALREMSESGKPKHTVYVFRSGKWSQIGCADLLPGDITSVARSKEPIIAPCTLTNKCLSNNDLPSSGDMLLLSGSCVVDEAMLTGESTPQLKVQQPGWNSVSPAYVFTFQESIHERSPEDALTISKDHVHLIFGGTTVIQTSPANRDTARIKGTPLSLTAASIQIN